MPARNQTAILLGAVLLGTGCSSQEAMPVTYPVTGSVRKLNGSPYTGGAVQFLPDNGEDLTVLGDIDKDGGFRLRTIQVRQRLDGAGWLLSSHDPARRRQRPKGAVRGIHD